MKSLVFVFCVLCFFSLGGLFSSCSANSGTELSSIGDDTLKMLADKKESDILWARELEPNRLTKSISTIGGISDGVSLSTFAVSAVEKDVLSQSSERIYPSLEGFGSLNITDISSELYTFLDDIALKIANKNLSDSNFSLEAKSTLVIFLYDLENFWKETFSSDFPLGEEKLFSSWIFGEPYENDSSVLLPVRFFSNEGFMDVSMAVKKGSSYLLSDLYIIRMEAQNGK